MARRVITAREQHQMLSPWRQAALNQNLVDRLHDEFHQWWHDGGSQVPRASDANGRGPLGHWPNIENFLHDTYPAAYRNHEMGMEEAGHILDGHEPTPYMEQNLVNTAPYETGLDAITRHGYDPKEVAAGMLLLHNQAHPLRGDMEQQDQDRLNSIVQKRMQMQRDYERRQRQAAIFLRMAGFDPREVTRQIGDEFRDWAGQNQHRLHKTAPYGPERDWRNIENFLGDRYPAAHRGFSLGQEEAADRLDRPRKGRGYRTGPEAVDRYGYDPKEIAAGALLLHNQSHPFRMDQSADLARLTRIYDQRQQMQRDYEQRVTTAATVDGDYAHIPRDENGRLLLWRGVDEGGAHMTYVNEPDPAHRDGNSFHFRPPESWDEVEHNHAAENWPNYGNWWGDEEEAKFYGGENDYNGDYQPHGAMAVQAWFPREQVHDSPSGHDGILVEPGAQGEITQAHVYHRDHGWLPLPDAPGRHVTAMPAVDAYDQNVRMRNRRDDQTIHPGPWYHGTDHEFAPGDMVIPHGGPSNWGPDGEDFYTNGRENRPDWVWMTPNPGQAANWGGRVYEVQPEVEGPWAWNLSPFHDDPGFFNEGYVSPRAKVVREFGPEDFKEHYRKLEEEMYGPRVTAMTKRKPVYFALNPEYPGHAMAYWGDRYEPIAEVKWQTQGRPGYSPGWKPSPEEQGSVEWVWSHPHARHKGITRSLLEWVRDNHEPNLHGSNNMTPAGRALSDALGQTVDESTWNRLKPVRGFEPPTTDAPYRMVDERRDRWNADGRPDGYV